MTKIRILPHPGEVLREEFLSEYGLSATKLAAAIGVPQNRISDILRERRGITADTSIRLGKFFGQSEGYWLHMQEQHDLSKARAEHEAEYESIKEFKPAA